MIAEKNPAVHPHHLILTGIVMNRIFSLISCILLIGSAVSAGLAEGTAPEFSFPSPDAEAEISPETAIHAVAMNLPVSNPNRWAVINEELREENRYTEALEAVRYALLYKPHDPNLYNLLGLTLTETGRYEDAISAFLDALRYKPRSAPLYLNLGTAYALAGNMTAATGAYTSALDLVPRYRTALNNLGLAYISAGEPASAVDPLLRSLDIFTGDPIPWINTGVALSLSGYNQTALKVLDHALTLSPSPSGKDEITRWKALINGFGDPMIEAQFPEKSRIDELMNRPHDRGYPGIIYPALNPSPGTSSEMLIRDIYFMYDGNGTYISLPISPGLYAAARGSYKAAISNLPEENSTPDKSRYYLAFITDPAQSDLISSLREQIGMVAGSRSGPGFLDAALAFVQAIPPDPAATEIRYPVETLLEFRGDCDDKSILLSSLLIQEEKLAIIEFPDHVILGAKNVSPAFRDSGYGGIDPSIYTEPGVIRPQYADAPVEIIPLS